MLPPRRGVEIHFHALPGLDDGPVTMGESLDLLGAAAADGTGIVVATPHVRSDFVTDVRDLPDRVGALQAAADEAGLGIDLLPGAELGHDMVGRLSQAELESIAQGPPSARWLLVEAPFYAIDADFHAAADELRDRGFGVLISHPERSADALLDESAGLRRALAAGSLAQVNAGSLTGAHGEPVRQAALGMVRGGLACAISSDAHGRARPPLLGEAGRQLLECGVDPALSRSLILGGPRRQLARGITRAPALAL